MIHAGHVYMYCYVDGDEEEIAEVILMDVARGKLHPFAGGMLRYLIRSDGTKKTD